MGEVKFYESDTGRSPVGEWWKKHVRGELIGRYDRALEKLSAVDLDQPNSFPGGLAQVTRAAYDNGHAGPPPLPLYKFELSRNHRVYFIRHGDDVVLLRAGIAEDEPKDIRRAAEHAEDYALRHGMLPERPDLTMDRPEFAGSRRGKGEERY